MIPFWNKNWPISAEIEGVVALVNSKVNRNNKNEHYMDSISSVSSTLNPYQTGGQADIATKAAKPATPTTPANTAAASGPVDSDGDHMIAILILFMTILNGIKIN